MPTSKSSATLDTQGPALDSIYTMASITFRTTEITLKMLERIAASRLQVEGIDHLQGRPAMFVINHFTRAETMIVPYALYKHTGDYPHTLADASLFKGMVGNYLEEMGVISTEEEHRDEHMIGDLISGRHNWVIYPEGTMIKSKKLIKRGKLVVTTPYRVGPPHTGAAILALKAEIYRRELLEAITNDTLDKCGKDMDRFNIASADEVSREEVVVVPVTMSYYPLRPGNNIVKRLFTRIFKSLSDRMLEELEIEGNLLLHKTDINIFVGDPIPVGEYLGGYFKLTRTLIPFLRAVDKTNLLLKYQATRMTRRFMRDIYENLAVNLDHLFCAGLRMRKGDTIEERTFKKVLFITAWRAAAKGIRLHPSAGDEIVSLVTDDSSPAYDSILKLAIDKKIVTNDDDALQISRLRLEMMHMFHTIRIKNPIIVIANELEPLKPVTRSLQKNLKRSDADLDERVIKAVVTYDRNRYRQDYDAFLDPDVSKDSAVGEPFFLDGENDDVGIVLSHGFLAAPLEVRPLAEHLNAIGYPVYVIRLPGHGTAPVNMAHVRWEEWVQAYMRGYAAIRHRCKTVVAGGFSSGGLLALEAASRDRDDIGAVFAINSPTHLKDIKARLAPAVDFWNEFLEKFNIESGRWDFEKTDPENPHINYDVVYVKGLHELDGLLHNVRRRVKRVTVPAYILHGDADPVVNPHSSRWIHSHLGSTDKTIEALPRDRHVIVQREGREVVFGKVADFIKRVTA